MIRPHRLHPHLSVGHSTVKVERLGRRPIHYGNNLFRNTQKWSFQYNYCLKHIRREFFLFGRVVALPGKSSKNLLLSHSEKSGKVISDDVPFQLANRNSD
jgi:hypothetical protein